MKKLFEKLLNLFKNKKVDLDNDGKIEAYHEEVKGLFSEFYKMSEKLSEVIDKLGDVVDDEKDKKVKSDERIAFVLEQENNKKVASDLRIANAERDMATNQKMQEKVREFIA